MQASTDLLHLQLSGFSMHVMKTQMPSKEAENTWLTLLRTQQLLLARVEAALKAAGLPPLAWYDVLLELSRIPEQPLRQFEIGERVLLNKHNLSRLIDRLEGEALVKRLACDDDGRGNAVKITRKGLQLKHAMWAVYGQAIYTLVDAPLSAAQLRTLTETLNRLTEHQRKTSPAP